MSFFLAYEKLDTPIHRLNVVTKVILLSTLLVLLILWLDFRLFIFLDIVILVIYHLSGAPKSWLKILLPLVAIPLIFTLFISAFLYNPALFKVYTQEFVSKELFRTTLPIVGELRITYGGLLWTFAMINRFMALPVFFVFMFTTSIMEIIDLLRLLKVPHGVAFSVAAAFKFIPDFINIFSTIVTAQKLRGLDPAAERNYIKRVIKGASLLVPMLGSVTPVAEKVALAAQIRAFGASNTATILSEFKFTKMDYTIIMVCLAVLGIAVFANTIYGIGLL